MLVINQFQAKYSRIQDRGLPHCGCHALAIMCSDTVSDDTSGKAGNSSSFGIQTPFLTLLIAAGMLCLTIELYVSLYSSIIFRGNIFSACALIVIWPRNFAYITRLNFVTESTLPISMQISLVMNIQLALLCNRKLVHVMHIPHIEWLHQYTSIS